MNDYQIKTILHLIDCEAIMSPLEDLKVALELIKRNPNLIKAYPGLEDSFKMLQGVIESESESQKSRAEQLKEIYES